MTKCNNQQNVSSQSNQSIYELAEISTDLNYADIHLACINTNWKLIYAVFPAKAIFAEIPGVLETGSARKVDRRYPFNDACQWFIDHADLILLVYDYTKLDIGPETELLLDQLKGRETQVCSTRDSVK